MHPLMVIPISARLGDNVAGRSGKMSWYEGKTLLEGLDDLQAAKTLEEGALRFPVQDVYEMNGDRVLVGRLASGRIKSGQEVVFHPLGKTATIDYIKVLEGKKDSAEAGESIGLVLKEGPAMQGLKRGETACDVSPSPRVSTTITAMVFWMSGEPLKKGDEIELKCATQQMMCKVKKITDRMNSSSLEIIGADDDELLETEVAKITLKADVCICTDPFEEVPEMGRFVLMRDTDTVAGGVVHG